MENKITGGQINAWLLAATVGPILSVVGRNGWLTVLPAAIVCGILCFCALSCRKNDLPRWLCVLELSWLMVFLAVIAKDSATCWANSDGFPVIPIVLLLLSAFAAKHGACRSGRIGATLVWFVVPVLGVVFLAGIADAEPQWIRPDIELPDATLIGVLLTPCLFLFLGEDKCKSARWITVWIGLIAIAGSLLLDAVIGPEDATKAPNGFYELSKSLNLFGVAERFEALIACVLTISWFAFFTLILSTAYQLTKKILPMLAKWSVWIVVVISGVLMCILPARNEWTAVLTLIFWGFIPALTQVLGRAKNIEKK